MDYSSIMKELLNPSSRPGRSGKDLSHRKVLTAKAGELLPILCEEMVPNDYFEIDTATLVRSFPLQTAAFLRARVHFDFFFVPKTAIWRNWDRFYYQRDDRQTSLMEGFAYEPNLTLEELAFYRSEGAKTSGAIDTVDARNKVLQLLGYGNFKNLTDADFKSGGQFAAIGQKSLTALPIAGYNRIYNMWYRNAWRDEPNAIDAQTYSLDAWDCGSYSTSLGSNNIPYGSGNVSDKFIQMHYHGWFSDLFMSSLPNQQFGSVSSISLDNKFIQLVDSSQSVLPNQSGVSLSTTFANGNITTSDGSKFLASNGSFDVITLRKALALQKWKEYNMRAGWKNKNQARAMFGVSTPSDRPHDVQFLKGYDFPFMIDEVMSTNGASGGNLADLAGKGIGVGNGEKLKFNSGERHGYLYCIAYIMPQAEYDANMIDKSLVRSEPFDHFVPAFENLGMEPVSKFELNARGNAGVFNNVLGYAPRYHEYKQRVDKVYGEFMVGRTLSSWVSVRRDLAGIANSGVIPTEYFYVNPSCLDTIFAQSAGIDQTTDQFMLNINFNFKAVRPMSDLGLPTL